MKKIRWSKWFGLLVLLLAACGSVPTGGLTSFMGQNAASTSQDIYIQEGPSGLVEAAAKSCLGDVNLQTNMVRLSFELTGDTAVFEPNDQPTFLFGGATPLLAHVPANATGTFRFRCEGEGMVTAVPVRSNGEIVGWAGGLAASRLTLELPSGGSKTVDSITLDGFFAPTIADLSDTIAALYSSQFNSGSEKNLVFESYFTAQKALYQNYPDPALMQQMALDGGLSETNAARMGQLYAGNVANKQTLLLDIVTSADAAYVEAVVGATISSLYTAGLNTEQIAQLMTQETNGRITVQFDEVGAGPWTVGVINQGNGSVTVQASSEASSEGGDTGSSGGDTGSGGGDSGGSAGGEQGGGEAGGEQGGEQGGGEAGGEQGGENGGAQGGGNGGNNGGNSGGDKPPFVVRLLWNVFMGAAAGAAVGAIEGMGVGAGPGAILGGGFGVAYTYAGGVWDPGPSDPNNPCSSPFVRC
jgi:hypothetical protein